MTTTELIGFLAALFSMMNPIGNVGIFAGMTGNKPPAAVRAIARKTAIAAAITLLVVIWAGGAILKLFGITVDEIRTAGGLIVLLIGLHMLFNKSEHKTSEAETADANNNDSIAVVPLAIPLLAGPGTMAAVLVAAQHNAGTFAKIELSLAAIGICIFTGILFAFSQPVSNKLGESGMAVVSRVMGMILMAIAIGMLASGLKGIFPILASAQS
ncbi:MarC family protein [Cochlodiniinecator piscidefendens]|uniref:MarC family protein n=1 Tax=Cochlodiniinecator piscidefendens TaxID=2715756 RepID=UPI0014092CD8|nr:MarC family protein [Cochlodiniinecator piscidefendens]